MPSPASYDVERPWSGKVIYRRGVSLRKRTEPQGICQWFNAQEARREALRLARLYAAQGDRVVSILYLAGQEIGRYEQRRKRPVRGCPLRMVWVPAENPRGIV